MILFPSWFLQILVIGGIVFCSAGSLMLLLFLFVDLKRKNLW